MVGYGGQLIVWRDGAPVVLARWPGVQVSQALQTRVGTVLIGGGQTALVRPDGDLRLLASNTHYRAAVDPAGGLLAFVESHVGRRSWARLHLIDLANGDRTTMPTAEEHEFLGVIGVYDGVVHVRGDHMAERTWRWRPGTDPEPLPYAVRHVDAYTGMLLADDGEPGRMLIDAAGGIRRVAAGPRTLLAPGAGHFYSWTQRPTALALVPVGAPAEVVTVALPDGSDTGNAAYRGPAWEDPHHVLVPAEHGRNRLGVPLVRVDVRTGAVEGIALPAEATHRPLLVEPLP
ncbi:hypothetical protein Prum_077460 [Phytohabitans rumicis]|uniref:Uncharacterized protein n=1 Tax=Phytohabitans rumicis TaxID=1076125 RepID=A0A6V8LCR4_9ACTN|nr:hypothetical protein Prum_077460 [Phytohabitans rumicis]